MARTSRIGVKIEGRWHDGCHPVMARLVRAICRGTCVWRWPGRALGRTHISEITWMINTLTAMAERSPVVMARLVRAICRGTDGLNPGHRTPLSGACLCQLQYRYEMCVRPRDEPGHDAEATGGPIL